MQNFIKTIVNAIQHWTKGKIKDSTADWNQNDPNVDSYVKNRTHWEEKVKNILLKEQTVTIAEGGDGYVELDYVGFLNAGQTYNVILNGVEYKCVAREWSDEEAVLLGNGTIYGDGKEGNGEPFSCDIYDDGSSYLNAAAGEYTISISTTRTFIHKLDSKYLPEECATVKEVETAQATADEAITNAANAQSTADTAVTNAATAQEAADNAQATVNEKMNIQNPEGTGAFCIDNYSSPLYEIVKTTQANPASSPTSVFVYYSSDCTFDASTGKYKLNNPKYNRLTSVSDGEYYVVGITYDSLVGTGYMWLKQSTNRIQYTSRKVIVTVGNGTSDDTRSNAHTLDWQGNAWFAGDVYVGSTSGTNRDEGSKKLATEEYMDSPHDAFLLTDAITNLNYHIFMQNGLLTQICKGSSIIITTLPNNLSYTEGTLWDPTGIELTLIREDATAEIIKDFTYYNKSDTIITFEYKEFNCVYTVDLEITKHPFDPAVELIDFEYVANSDGTYSLISWKQTYQGESSTEMIIPDNSLIKF